jgi:hypothetical protein
VIRGAGHGLRPKRPARRPAACAAAAIVWCVALLPATAASAATSARPPAAATTRALAGEIIVPDDCTISGTDKADVLDGTEGNDVICGLGGKDVIDGMKGDDVLIGGNGGDDLIGGGGDDVLEGDLGADRLEGNGGADTLNTQDGVEENDAAGGGTGEDTCIADADDWCTDDGHAFGGESSIIDDDLKEEMTGSSWRTGCPVPISDLRLLEMNYWNWKEKPRRGVMVVHKDHTGNVLDAFETIFDARFQMKKMQLIDDYGADDDASMAADNTVAFNCRYLAGTTTWSQHAYGRAIDINPIENPYLKEDGSFVPPAGKKYLDRSLDLKGMIAHGDEVWDAFDAVGWEWGGDWDPAKDYQHFSSNGK